MFDLSIALVELGVEFLIEVFKLFVKKLAWVIAILDAFCDVIVKDFEFLDMLSNFVWILAFMSKHLHGAAIVVEVKFQIWELGVGVLTKGVK